MANEKLDKKKKKSGPAKSAEERKQALEAAGAAKPAAAPDDGKCVGCGGALVDMDDYLFHQKLKRAAVCIPAAIGVCIAWAVLFALLRTLIGGKLFSQGGGAVAMLIGNKALVGAILGAVLGAVAGLWGSDVGLFLGVVAGSIGGFFVANAAMMPLQSDAAHRIDIVIAAIGGGLLSGATVLIAHGKATAKHAKYIGPEPVVNPDNKQSA